MSPVLDDKVEVRDTADSGKVTITLDPAKTTATVGQRTVGRQVSTVAHNQIVIGRRLERQIPHVPFDPPGDVARAGPFDDLPIEVPIPDDALDPSQAGIPAALRIGGGETRGRIFVLDEKDVRVLNFDARFALLELGGENNAGDLRLLDRSGKIRVHLDGQAGDVKLLGADCAEDFALAEEDGPVEPGTVMVLDDDGNLRSSRLAYDRRVAGVISGAGTLRPGIVLGRGQVTGRYAPLALAGRVFCKVDAAFGSITVGDLLTTSPAPGHAMRAQDPLRAFGAVIGKALAPLSSGQALVPVLVALQ